MSDLSHVTYAGRFALRWIDRGREPTQPPDPAYPAGVDLDMTAGAAPACQVALPHPAPRCGNYVVTCRLCGLVVTCTTAGRPDDPRSLRLACRAPGGTS